LHPSSRAVLACRSRWLDQSGTAEFEYLRTENQVRRETHGTQRILRNDDQRRRLAIKGEVWEAILRWQR